MDSSYVDSGQWELSIVAWTIIPSFFFFLGRRNCVMSFWIVDGITLLPGVARRARKEVLPFAYGNNNMQPTTPLLHL
jgi:hypothetical protein